MTGGSLAFETLIDGLQARKLAHSVVDTTRGRPVTDPGRFHLDRVIANLLTLARAWWYMLSHRKLYLIASCSRLGFLRDLGLVWVAWLLRRRIALHFHTGGYGQFYQCRGRAGRLLIRLTLNRAHRLIVLAESLRSQLDFLGDSAPIDVIANGLPLGLNPRHTAKTLPGPDEPLQLLYLSNLMPSKGYLTLLHACRELATMGTTFRCHFCGSFSSAASEHAPLNEAQLRREFQSALKLGDLEQTVRWHGELSGSDKQEMLERAHILILPTTYPWEGQPLCLIEAMAFATPAISTPHMGIPELLGEGVAGTLVGPDDPIELARAIRELADDPMTYADISASSLKRYHAHFTRERHLDQMLELLESV